MRPLVPQLPGSEPLASRLALRLGVEVAASASGTSVLGPGHGKLRGSVEAAAIGPAAEPSRPHRPRPHRPYTLVLSGGGARGFAHVGALRALESFGWRPAALVGVSMGALVGVAWALREDWYPALMRIDAASLPRPLRPFRSVGTTPWRARAGGCLDFVRAGWDMFVGWGVGAPALRQGRLVLRDLTQGKRLEQGRVPVVTCATDLRTGDRIVLEGGDAAEAIYASTALAGVFPPLRRGECLLADGAYADIAPVDVARELGPSPVIAVDAGQELQAREPTNGFEALSRAVEICQRTHAHLRLERADLVLRPAFRRPIDTLEFSARRECAAAGAVAVRQRRQELADLLVNSSVNASSRHSGNTSCHCEEWLG